MSDIFIARQAIYTRSLEVYAYELLFRSDYMNSANITCGEDATSQVFINALMDIGLSDLVGNQRAFINCTERYLVEGLPAPVVPTQMVLEVLEDILPTDELINALIRLREQGYQIALDDFVYDESKRGLVENADIIKLDALALDETQLTEQVKILKGFGVPLLAEKVETLDSFALCNKLGFDFFQGYFFCRPNIVKGKHTPSSKLAIMQLLAKMGDPNLEFRDLEKLIVNDVTMSYRILRYINSAMYSLPRKVDSIHRAITLLGLKTIKSWISILAMTNVDDKPYELMRIAMLRAKMCEGLAELSNSAQESAFTVGLFSTLDALMDQELEDILVKLPLAEEINNALLNKEGPLGAALLTVLAYEKGDWDNALATSALDAEALRNNYLQAMRWADETTRSLVAA
jgi:EAL and modified HD-GYP domain-containing signal transduction protein